MRSCKKEVHYNALHLLLCRVIWEDFEHKLYIQAQVVILFHILQHIQIKMGFFLEQPLVKNSIFPKLLCEKQNFLSVHVIMISQKLSMGDVGILFGIINV